MIEESLVVGRLAGTRSVCRSKKGGTARPNSFHRTGAGKAQSIPGTVRGRRTVPAFACPWVDPYRFHAAPSLFSVR